MDSIHTSLAFIATSTEVGRYLWHLGYSIQWVLSDSIVAPRRRISPMVVFSLRTSNFTSAEATRNIADHMWLHAESRTRSPAQPSSWCQYRGKRDILCAPHNVEPLQAFPAQQQWRTFGSQAPRRCILAFGLITMVATFSPLPTETLLHFCRSWQSQ